MRCVQYKCSVYSLCCVTTVVANSTAEMSFSSARLLVFISIRIRISKKSNCHFDISVKSSNIRPLLSFPASNVADNLSQLEFIPFFSFMIANKMKRNIHNFCFSIFFYLSCIYVLCFQLSHISILSIFLFSLASRAD